MNSFREIVERVKDEISGEVDGIVKDVHVGNALGLTTNTVRIYKTKDYIPYDNVINFCIRYKLSVDWMLFGDYKDKNIYSQ